MSDRERERMLELLLRDVTATLGTLQAVNARMFASEDVTLNPHRSGEDLVQNIQQCFHDEFIDTTWPACPRHPNHPLWFGRDDSWGCTKDGVAVARLGELGQLRNQRPRARDTDT